MLRPPLPHAAGSAHALRPTSCQESEQHQPSLQPSVSPVPSLQVSSGEEGVSCTPAASAAAPAEEGAAEQRAGVDEVGEQAIFFDAVPDFQVQALPGKVTSMHGASMAPACIWCHLAPTPKASPSPSCLRCRCRVRILPQTSWHSARDDLAQLRLAVTCTLWCVCWGGERWSSAAGHQCGLVGSTQVVG